MTTKKRIVIVEPSEFRRAETYVLGPFSRLRAWWVAHKEVDKHPFGEARVVSADAIVMRGDEVLWNGPVWELENL